MTWPGSTERYAPNEHPRTTETPHDARERLVAVRHEVAKAVVGQDAAVSGLLVALLCGGHVLMEGVPGTAKTLLVRTLSASLSVSTRRVQFTPDLMPGDITGSMVIDSRQGELSFREGPVFTNLLLADEINRTPPKTQSALLEAMEEGQVSVDGVTHQLPRPFLVAATQNPVEYEGTYPLPEAQLDRFLLKVVLPIPERPDELEILTRHAAGFDPRDVAGAGVTAVASGEDIAAGQAAVKTVQVSPEVAGYIVDVARATRESPSLSLGVSPRGATALLRSARAWAWLQGRDFVTPDDVKSLAHATLVHRLGLRPEAELEGVDVSQVLSSALGSVPVSLADGDLRPGAAAPRPGPGPGGAATRDEHDVAVAAARRAAHPGRLAARSPGGGAVLRPAPGRLGAVGLPDRHAGGGEQRVRPPRACAGAGRLAALGGSARTTGTACDSARATALRCARRCSPIGAATCGRLA